MVEYEVILKLLSVVVVLLLLEDDETLGEDNMLYLF